MSLQPAFPNVDGEAGMTVRDYFAAKAMQGLLAARLPDHHGEDGPEVLARDAYIVADAMLKEREGTE